MNNIRYLWDAEDYARHSSEQFVWAQGLLQKLDLDCGDGKITALLAERSFAGPVVGIDAAWGMVSLAKSQYYTPSAAGPNFFQMDAAELGFREVFQVVFSNAVLHWVHDHRAVLAGIYRSLVPGGCCLLQMGGKGNASQMIAVLDQIIGRPHWRDFFSEFRFPYRFYSDEKYRPLLQAAGLTISRVELVHKNMQHHGKEKLAGWLRTAWLPYIQQVSAGSRESFIAEVAAAYRRNYPPDSEGIVHVPMVRLEVEAFRE